jgi:formylmethanofuran dehydrogenase subunit C
VSYLQAQDEIEARVKAANPYVTWYRGNMSDDKFAELVAQSDALNPFGTLAFGGKIDPRGRVNGIVGAAKDSSIVTIVIRCVASTDRTSQQVLEIVGNSLEGFAPTLCGEIRPALFGGSGEVSSLGNPTRYAAVQAYTMTVNKAQ